MNDKGRIIIKLHVISVIFIQHNYSLNVTVLSISTHYVQVGLAKIQKINFDTTEDI